MTPSRYASYSLWRGRTVIVELATLSSEFNRVLGAIRRQSNHEHYQKDDWMGSPEGGTTESSAYCRLRNEPSFFSILDSERERNGEFFRFSESRGG